MGDFSSLPCFLRLIQEDLGMILKLCQISGEIYVELPFEVVPRSKIWFLKTWDLILNERQNAKISHNI